MEDERNDQLDTEGQRWRTREASPDEDVVEGHGTKVNRGASPGGE